MSYTKISHTFFFFENRVLLQRVVKSFLWPRPDDTWQASRAPQPLEGLGWAWLGLASQHNAPVSYHRWYLEWNLFVISEPNHTWITLSYCLIEFFFLNWFILRDFFKCYKIGYLIYCEDDFEDTLQYLIHRVNLSGASLSTMKSCESPDQVVCFLICGQDYKSCSWLFSSLLCLLGSSGKNLVGLL